MPKSKQFEKAGMKYLRKANNHLKKLEKRQKQLERVYIKSLR
jgi:hypothetical protein